MILDSNEVVNYRGLWWFLEKLKGFFIKKPNTGSEGQYLRRTASGNAEWASFPTVLRWKGKKDNISEIWAITNALEGDVWSCLGDEYYCIEPTTTSDYGQSHWDLLGKIFPEYSEGDNISINDATDPRTISAIGYTYNTTINSFSEGPDSTAIGSKSHAEGDGAVSYGDNAHAEGSSTSAVGISSHAEGIGNSHTTQETYSGNTTLLLSSGTPSVKVRDIIYYNGEYRKVKTVAALEITIDTAFTEELVGAHVLKITGVSYGENSHVEGNSCVAIGADSHTEGEFTVASGSGTHTEGAYTTAIGAYAHAEGLHSTAFGSTSHAEGTYTESNNSNEHAEGTYNWSHRTENIPNKCTIHSIGIGDSTQRKNAFEVMLNGDAYLNGVGGYTGTTIKDTGNNIKTLLDVITQKSDWNAASGADNEILNKPNLATVATTGAYSDLSGTPTIPSEVTETTVTNWGFTKNLGTLTGVTYNGINATVTSGVAAIKDNEVITSNLPTTITYETPKYIKKSLTGGSFTITVDTTGTGITDNGAREVIYRIDNSTADASITVTGGINMFDSGITSGVTLPAGKTMELVFTFWSPTDVTFNGGISL